MAKILISFDHYFKTSGIEVTNQDSFESEILSGSAAIEYFGAADQSKFSIFVIGFSDEAAVASFEFLPNSMKKGGEFVVSINQDGSGLVAKAKGDFELKLRAGVAPALGDSPIFKVEGIAYMGGSYNGFMSRLVGQTEENNDVWMSINDVQIK